MNVAGIVFDYFESAGTTKAFERLCCVMPAAPLREIQGMTEELPQLDRKRQLVLVGAADPFERLFSVGHALIILERV